MTQWYRITDAYKTIEDDGFKQSTPIVHIFGRDIEWNRQHLRIQYRPYFLVRQSEWMSVGEGLANDNRVTRVATTDYRGRTERAIDGEQLFRVVCRTPEDVRDLRETVDDPFEADISFAQRLLIDLTHSQWIGVKDDCEPDSILSADALVVPDYDNQQCEPPETIPPIRHCIYDIEVQQGGDGPPVVTTEGTERAANPITAITAYDSYTTEYHSWLLTHDEWDKGDIETVRNVTNDVAVPLNISVYDNPRDVVGQFCEWVIDREMDSMVGWNAGSFDHPYLVNYGLQNGVGAVKRLSPSRDVYPMDGNGSWINSSLKGRLLLDLMVLYDKCVVSELDSKRLTDVADSEDIAVGKLDIEDAIGEHDGPAIDVAWQQYPETFCRYSLRDTMACVGIVQETQQDVTII